MLTGKLQAPQPGTFLILTCLAFTIVAGVTRSILTHVHSRLQIAAFCLLAILFQLVLRQRFGRLSTTAMRFAFVWNAAAATLAIIAVRTALEGLPVKLLSIVRTL